MKTAISLARAHTYICSKYTCYKNSKAFGVFKNNIKGIEYSY